MTHDVIENEVSPLYVRLFQEPASSTLAADSIILAPVVELTNF